MRAARWVLRLLALGALAYVIAFVPLGNRTGWQHLRAIWRTDAAQEATKAAFGKAREVAATVTRTLREGPPGSAVGATPRDAERGLSDPSPSAAPEAASSGADNPTGYAGPLPVPPLARTKPRSTAQPR